MTLDQAKENPFGSTDEATTRRDEKALQSTQADHIESVKGNGHGKAIE